MKYKYKIQNLDCANCANEIEEHLKKDSNLKSVVVNFSKLTLTFQTDITENVKEYVSRLVKQVEPDVKILDENEEYDNKSEIKLDIIRFMIGILLSAIGLFTKGTIAQILILIGYVVLLYKVALTAIKLLLEKNINENLLITVSCVGAYLIGNVKEGLMVIILYEIGKILEKIAVNRSRKSIADLMDIKPEFANVKRNNKIETIQPELVKIGDIIIVKKGERVPLDGILQSKVGKLDTAALTGESKLRTVETNDLVLSGSINCGEVLEIEVSQLYQNSTVSRILDLVETATDKKAKTETFVASVAKVYTPIVLLLSALTIIIFPLFGLSFNESIYRALSFLVISCPCAIAISVPLSYFTGIGYAAKQGILMKGSDYLDGISNIKTIIFDKTGTLTKGKFEDYELKIMDSNYNEQQIMEYYGKGESFSTHPIAKSILDKINQKIVTDDVSDVLEISGKGVSYKIGKDKIIIGSSKLVGLDEKGKGIYLKINENVIAELQLIDGIKPTAKKTISDLKKRNIKTMMFTGDSKEIALKIGNELGIDSIKYELLPEDKYHLLEEEIKKESVAFVGDGINDAPSLALANIGISMGNIGSAAAIEASDIVIIEDDILKIITAIDISKKTKKIIKQNLIFSIGVKIAVLILAAVGIASMWQAVFADTGVTLIAIINTTRILKK